MCYIDRLPCSHRLILYSYVLLTGCLALSDCGPILRLGYRGAPDPGPVYSETLTEPLPVEQIPTGFITREKTICFVNGLVVSTLTELIPAELIQAEILTGKETICFANVFDAWLSLSPSLLNQDQQGSSQWERLFEHGSSKGRNSLNMATHRRGNSLKCGSPQRKKLFEHGSS